MSSQGRGQRLRGRAAECETLRGLVSTVQSGSHQVLVLRGEAGVGKTALLGYLSELASEFRCVQVAGVQSDMELAFAGLQQLCAPLMDRFDELPPAAARGAERRLRPRSRTDARPLPGRVGSAEPDGRRRQRPAPALHHRRRAVARPGVGADALVSSRGGCWPSRSPWSSRPATAARRRWPGCRNWRSTGCLTATPASCLSSVILGGSMRGCETASSLRRAAFRWHCSRCRETTRRRNWPAASGIWLCAARRDSSRKASCAASSLFLPTTQRLLLVAAAEPVGDAALFLRAAANLGIPVDALAPAEAAGVIEFGPRMRFHHPWLRSAAYRAADLTDRRVIHRALADATDPRLGPRPSGVARRQCRGGTRRCGRRGAGNLSRPCAEQGRRRRGGSFLGARDRFDVGPGPARFQGDRRGAGQRRCGSARGCIRPTRDRRTGPAVQRFNAAKWLDYALRWTSPATAAVIPVHLRLAEARVATARRRQASGNSRRRLSPGDLPRGARRSHVRRSTRRARRTGERGRGCPRCGWLGYRNCVSRWTCC